MELKDRIANLSEEKRVLLERLLAKKQAEAANEPGIPRRLGDNLPSLSFSQSRLWFLDQFAPGSPLYNIPCRLRLIGNLDVSALGRAINEIVGRHEALRTTFAMVGESPVQVIHEPFVLPLPLVDLSFLTDEGRAAERQRQIEAEALRPFALEVGPLFRATLLKLDEEEHLLLLTLHHIVSDGWSLGVLVGELGVLYNAFCRRQPSPLLPLALQYADYACWQRGWLQGAELERQVGYWKEQLRGAPTLLELPTDRPRPPVQSFQGAQLRLGLSAEVTRGLKALGQQEGVTLFMTLLAAFQTLLYRYSGQEDIVVGTPIANRTRPEVEGLIGFFANTLPMRGDLSGDPSFIELLARVKEVALGAYAHQDLPFEKLVEEISPQRSLSHSPLFQVMLILQNVPRTSIEWNGLQIQSFAGEGVTAKFDLCLAFSESGDKLGGALEYNTDLFDGERIERMLSHLQTLLEGIVADPHQPLSRLPLLSQTQQQQLLHEWNATAVAYPHQRGAHQLFEEQVERTPEAVAVVFEAQSLTYQQLNARSNQLAHYLRQLGVGPDGLVGICLNRSIEMVVGLLGILKAGGAYVPLDPDYPLERLAFMIQDSRIQLLLTQDCLRERMEGTGVQVVLLDSDWERIGVQSEHNLPSATTGDNLAYLLYTSGTTATPKGVLIRHQGLSNYLHWSHRAYALHSGQGSPVHSSLAFDLTVTSLFPALLAGRTVHLLAQAAGVEGLADALGQAQDWSLVKITPAHLELLSRQLPPQQADGRTRAFVIGGEALLGEQVAFWRRHAPQTRLINEYGPTETVVGCCVYECDAATPQAGPLPIGRPIANTRLYILDARLQPVPVGVAGELYIGGDGLGRGYLNRPDLTAEKFMADPFAGEAGARMYRSGDLCRYLPDGNIAFLGRVDHQVKVRGFRIELGEIESVLGEHAGVSEAIVVAREDTPGDKRLVAYVVGKAGALPVGELRSHLGARLPEYMLPGAFVFVEALPLNANGKVDRKALPPPAGQGYEDAYVAPRTPLEEGIAEIWKEVLRLEQVGVHDNFFALGGHSLLATQVIARVRNTFLVDLALVALFEAPTIAGLAQRVAEARGEQGQGPCALGRVARDGGAPLSFAQQRLWFLHQFEPGSPLYNIPLGLRLSGRLNEAALGSALSEIVGRHEALRTTFTTNDGEPTQVIQAAQEVVLALTDLRASPPQERSQQWRALVQAEALRPFALEVGPLFRATLLKLDEEEHLLLLTLHHIVSDGWSLGVLVGELGVLYNAFCRRQPSPLLPLALQYADYACWQRGWLQGAELERQVGYWKEQLRGAPTLLELPTDRPRPPVQSFQGAQLRLGLSAEVTQGLKALGQQEGVTLFMTLLAAFQTLLYRYSGQEDIVVGTPIANRTHAEAEGLIGLFMNTLALRQDLSGDPSFTQLLARVRHTALGAYAHQDLPFEKLVEEISPQRSLSHSPLFQVMLILQNAPRTTLELEGVRLQAVGSEGVTAKFDLCLALSESGGKLGGALEYNTDLFEEASLQRLLEHFQTLLQGIVADPHQPLSRLPLLSKTQQHQRLQAGNPAPVAYPHLRCLHQLLHEQAQRTPHALAVVCQEQSLTYQQLDARANQLAHFLHAQGVGPETLVGLCLERSVDMLVGMLGILKAGGAYVPLDPAWPTQRLQHIVENTALALALTHASLLPLLPTNLPRALCLQALQPTLAQQSTRPLPTRVHPQNLAYVLHTSGSTGAPKGVPIPHQALVNFLASMAQTPGLSAQDVLVALTTLSFDIAALEMWLPLLVGARVVVASREEAREAPRLAALLARSQATVLQATPATWRMLVSGETAGLGGLKALCGGEGLPRELAEDLLGAGCALWNLYGPTETTIWSSVGAVEQAGEGPICVGAPIANTRLYVLDRHLQPVPVGVRGEIFIGGAGLSRGYLNRPDLTAEKFVADPFAGEAGARMYRTGDVGRYRGDGGLECVGRVDHQVKVRGFRIELGEIESVLGEHAGVSEAIVVAREDTPGDKRLVAYVVGKAGALPVGELRSHLGARLPEYMLPGAFVFVEALPLNANGKVDRKALPPPAGQGYEDAYVAPRTPLEEGIAEIWKEVLRLEQVGVHDNFFALGGHSLLATQVIARVREAFQVDVPLRALFESPTVFGLTHHVEISRREGHGLCLPPLLPVSRDVPMSLSFSQQRLWFIDQLQPGSFLYNMPRILRLRGRLNVSALQRALREIVRRHEILRTIIVTEGADAIQVISAATDLPLPLTDLCALPDEERAEETYRLCREEAIHPFDLSRDKMLRAQLLKLSAEEHLLLLTLHHIASDGWSMGILNRELILIYNAFRAGEASPLSEMPIQYADYAVWQRHWLQGEELVRQVAYWREQLSGAPPVLRLPTDHPREAAASYRGATHRFSLPSEVSALMRELCRQERATPFMGLLAAFKVLLYHLTGQKDLVVGTDVANRTQPQTEGLIGFFLNHLVLRTDLSGEPNFREVVRRTRETALGAYAHQDLPFEKLVETLRPERNLSHTPLFQVLFVVNNLTRGSVLFDGLDTSVVDSQYSTSKFDLALFMGERTTDIVGSWVYRTDLFEADTITQMSEQFVVLLSQLLTHPETCIEDLEIRDAGDNPKEQTAERALRERLHGARRSARVVVEHAGEN